MSLALDFSQAVFPSPGCGRPPPIASGIASAERLDLWVRDSSQPGGWASRNYWLSLPSAYSRWSPQMLVLDFHGFYDTARRERREDRLAFFVDQWQLDVVVAEPHGSGDAYSGDSRAWNVDGNGLNTDPGPRGPTCLAPRYNGDGWNDRCAASGDRKVRHPHVPCSTRENHRYKCYDSCAGCDSTWGCNFASCMDDRSLVESLFRRLSATLCLDLEEQPTGRTC